MSSAHRSSSGSNPATFKFPPLPRDSVPYDNDHPIDDSESHEREFSPVGIAPLNGGPREDRWQARKSFQNGWTPGAPGRSGSRRGRQKSLSEALRTISTRRGSVSDNAHEIAEALKAPVSYRLIALCGVWYMTSIFSNASSKSILTAFRQPITLTLIQFAFVSTWCFISSWAAHRFPTLKKVVPALRYSIQPPSKDLLRATLPLTAFQIGGHIMNSDAMSRIPVSLVHTIKGLSPLFTVLAYRLIFRIHYSVPTYLSLVPLTLGVVMACSADVSTNTTGLVSAFGSALLFVTQNIVSKRLFNEAARAETEGLTGRSAAKKPDKLNLLCYSSILAFTFTLPIWVWSEAPGLFKDVVNDGAVELSQRPDALDHGRLALEFVFNGTFHFAQSLVAFILLSMVSPVTYSVASLIKRVFVIGFAIVWFGNPVTTIQGVGIGFTFLGLYLYDRTHDASRADRRARLQQGRAEPPVLPFIAEHKRADGPQIMQSPLDISDVESAAPNSASLTTGIGGDTGRVSPRQTQQEPLSAPGTLMSKGLTA